MMLPSNRRERNTLSPVMPGRRSGDHLIMRLQGSQTRVNSRISGRKVGTKPVLRDRRFTPDARISPRVIFCWLRSTERRRVRAGTRYQSATIAGRLRPRILALPRGGRKFQSGALALDTASARVQAVRQRIVPCLDAVPGCQRPGQPSPGRPP
jgi:hypothetical protein